MSYKYRIDWSYCWYNRGTQIVKMYYIEDIPFTYDELDESVKDDIEIIEWANREQSWEVEELYQKSYYLVAEEMHPCLFELQVDHPELLPVD